MKYLEVVNLNKYQHYSDRPIIWIKWYLKATNDYKFQQLTDSERWLFVGLIMIGVECHNAIPRDALWIYQRVSYRSPKGSYRVGIGVKKMLKLGLLRQKNDSIENIREDKRREEKSSSSKKKPFYGDREMRKDSRGKWWVIPKDGGQWLEFAGKLSDIEYK